MSTTPRMENDANSLQLNINIPPDLVNFSIPAMPVWLRPFDIDEIKAFRMGVEFLISPDGEQMRRLESVMRKKQAQRDELWNSMAMPYLKKERGRRVSDTGLPDNSHLQLASDSLPLPARRYFTLNRIFPCRPKRPGPAFVPPAAALIQLQLFRNTAARHS